MKISDDTNNSGTTEMRRIDPKAIKKWRLSRLIVLLFMIAIMIAGYFLFWHKITDGMSAEDLHSLIFSISLFAGGVLLFQLINLIVYPVIEYRQWSYCLTADRIEIKKGIFFHSTTIIPITRIQHVTVSEGPFARLYGLAKVDITTAGSTNEIDGLAAETARELCDRMKNAVNTKVLNSKLRQSESQDNIPAPVQQTSDTGENN